MIADLSPLRVLLVTLAGWVTATKSTSDPEWPVRPRMTAREAIAPGGPVVDLGSRERLSGVHGRFTTTRRERRRRERWGTYVWSTMRRGGWTPGPRARRTLHGRVLRLHRGNPEGRPLPWVRGPPACSDGYDGAGPGWQVSTTNGPFDETREQLGGFYFIKRPGPERKPSRWPRRSRRHAWGASSCGRSGSSAGRKENDFIRRRDAAQHRAPRTCMIPMLPAALGSARQRTPKLWR
jgi:hypothetical protein